YGRLEIAQAVLQKLAIVRNVCGIVDGVRWVRKLRPWLGQQFPGPQELKGAVFGVGENRPMRLNIDHPPTVRLQGIRFGDRGSQCASTGEMKIRKCGQDQEGHAKDQTQEKESSPKGMG